MSEYTREEILKLIEENGGPEGLDLSGKDLSDIDLSWKAIEVELEKARRRAPDETPLWYSEATKGINLVSVDFQGAFLVSTDLQGADLVDANLQGTNLEGAKLQGASLRAANLNEAVLKRAKADKYTIWPEGLEVPEEVLLSEYTREEITKLIEENGGPEGLDLFCVDLAGLDLGWEAIEKELARTRVKQPDALPVWYSRNTEGINLRGVRLTLADCRETNLEWADLEGAKLSDSIFDKVHLWRANLRGAILTTASFREADLNCADLRDSETFDTDFRGARLNGARLEGVYLFTTRSLVGIHIGSTVLDRTQMRWEQLGGKIGEEIEGNYWLAKEAYLNLKGNFTSLGRYDDASKAYIKERQMEKMCSAPWRAGRVYMGKWDLGYSYESKLPFWHPRVLWFYTRHTLKWLADWFVELLCDYGESIGRVLVWMFASFLGFAAYYWRISGVWLVEPNGEAKVATSFWHYLIYSAGAFTTTQFARLQAADHRVRMVTAFQAIVGIFLAGLLGFVAGNRIRRS